MKISRKIIILTIATFVCLMSTACGETLKGYVQHDLGNQLSEKVDANIMIVDQLKQAGFLSENEAASVTASLNTQKADFETQIRTIEGSGKIPGNLTGAISSFRIADGSTLHYLGNTDSVQTDEGSFWDTFNPKTSSHQPLSEKLNCLILTNYLCLSKGGVAIWGDTPKKGFVEEDSEDNWYTKTSSGNYCPINEKQSKIWHVKDTGINPIVLVADDIETSIESKFDYEVYVLKPDIVTGDDSGSIDIIITALQSAITKSGNNKSNTGMTVSNTALLEQYFQKATTKDGKSIKLIDKDGSGNIPDEYKLVKVSSANDLDTGDTTATPGKDLIVKQYNVPMMSLRFKEFDQTAVDNLNALMGLQENKYVFCEVAGSKRAYLMEYPVSVLSSIEQVDDNKVNGTLASSGIGVNLFTGKIVKYDVDSTGVKWLASGTAIDNSVENYLNVDAASSNNETSKSSFILKGMTTTTISYNLSSGEAKQNITTGRIVLRDYLEATYAPGFIDNEPVVSFGRKIRVNFSQWDESVYDKNNAYTQYSPYWDKTQTFGYYVDKSGDRIETSPTLKITDLADINYLMTGTTSSTWTKNKLYSIVEPGQKTSKTEATAEAGEVHSADQLEKYTVDSKKLQTTLPLPSKYLAKEDFDNDTTSKQRFYVLATKYNMFDTGLFSDWIESTSSTASLDWWDSYLATYNYLYSPGHEAVNNYLKTNYAYELSQNGVVVLDLETVSKVQEIFDDKTAHDRVSNIRTFFMILGWVLIIYSMILMLCWGVDANMDIGVKLLEKATFGHWVAIKYEDDVPYMNTNGRTYLTGSKMFIRCLIIISLGLIIIYVNIFTVVLRLIELFGSFASKIEKIILGTR